MAQIVKPDSKYMPLPIGISRENPVPVDKTLVWSDRNKLEEYAAQVEGGTSYVGQILSLVGDGTVSAYAISDVSGNMVRMVGSSELSQMSSGIYASLSGLSGDVESAIGTLSASASSTDVVLGNRITALSGAVTGELSKIDNRVTELSGIVSGIATSGAVGELSANARKRDDALASSIETLSGVVSSIAASGVVGELSANALARDNALASSISSVSSNAASSIETLSQSISTLSGNASSTDAGIVSSIGTLSSDLHELSGVVSSLATSGAIGTLSANALARDNSLQSSIESLASSTSGSVEELEGSISSLSGNASSTDAGLASSISTLASHVDDTDASVSELSGMVGTISGYAKDADDRIARSTDQKLERSAIVTELTDSSLDTTVPGTLAVYRFVNSSIVNLAAYYLTKNAAGDSFATKAELNAAIASGTFYNGGQLRNPQKNDYCIVQSDEDHQASQGGSGLTTRYIYDGTKWVYQYALNNSSFTEAQLASINSKMTETIHGTITSNIQTISGYTRTLSAYSLTSHTHSTYATTASVNNLEDFVYEIYYDTQDNSTAITNLNKTVGGHTTSINSINTTLANFGSVISAISSSLNTLQNTVNGLSAVYLKIADMKAFEQWS